mmetsp:Transcript_117994/g.378255  ORF Transcript_117994/g.378255 Transcript_117994/m.378255 type:complete len:269 (+) Transcript_117994:1589-2395(+)
MHRFVLCHLLRLGLLRRRHHGGERRRRAPPDPESLLGLHRGCRRRSLVGLCKRGEPEGRTKCREGSAHHLGLAFHLLAVLDVPGPAHRVQGGGGRARHRAQAVQDLPLEYRAPVLPLHVRSLCSPRHGRLEALGRLRRALRLRLWLALGDDVGPHHPHCRRQGLLRLWRCHVLHLRALCSPPSHQHPHEARDQRRHDQRLLRVLLRPALGHRPDGCGGPRLRAAEGQGRRLTVRYVGRLVVQSVRKRAKKPHQRSVGCDGYAWSYLIS